MSGPSRCVHLLLTAAVLTAAGPARGEDPLDRLDGTEGWADIDTGAVDLAEAWASWRRDLRRWHAGRARLAAERARMAQIRGGGSDEPLPVRAPDPAGHQARVDRARGEAEAGGPDRRDARGQSLDDERPWRRR